MNTICFLLSWVPVVPNNAVILSIQSGTAQSYHTTKHAQPLITVAGELSDWLGEGKGGS